MIYIVEVPHQAPATCWTADNKLDLQNILRNASASYPDAVGDSIDDLLEWNAHDLSRQHVFWTDEEAIEAADDNDFWGWSSHQGIAARARLDEVIPERLSKVDIDVELTPSGLNIDIPGFGPWWMPLICLGSGVTQDMLPGELSKNIELIEQRIFDFHRFTEKFSYKD